MVVCDTNYYPSVLQVVCRVIFLLYFAPRFELHGPTETPKIEIKQSKRPKKSKNQIPLPSHSSHPTPKWNQNNQNTGIVPVNIEHWLKIVRFRTWKYLADSGRCRWQHLDCSKVCSVPRGWAHSKHYDTEPPPPPPNWRHIWIKTAGYHPLRHGEGEEDEGEEPADGEEDDLGDAVRLQLVIDEALDDQL